MVKVFPEVPNSQKIVCVALPAVPCPQSVPVMVVEPSAIRAPVKVKLLELLMFVEETLNLRSFNLIDPFELALIVTSPILFSTPPPLSPVTEVLVTTTVGIEPTNVIVGAATLGVIAAVFVPDVYLT